MFCGDNPVSFRDPFGLAIVVNNTGSGIVVSGNVGSGHGAGGANGFGVVPAGSTGGGIANPVSAYVTRGEAIDAANPNFVGPVRYVGPITDIDYFDDPCPKKKHNPDQADYKLPGDEIGPTYNIANDPDGSTHGTITNPRDLWPALGRRIKEGPRSLLDALRNNLP